MPFRHLHCKSVGHISGKADFCRRAAGVHHLTEIGRIIEVVAQPIGPQKLAKVLHRCLQRYKMLDRTSQALSSNHVKLALRKTDPTNTSNSGEGSSTPEATTNNPSSNAASHDGGPDSPSRPPGPKSRSSTQDVRKERPDPSPQQAPQPKIDPSLPRVLVVDDNHINLQLMVTFVRKIKHAYESAVDGDQAFEAYKRSATDPKTDQPSSSAPKRFKYILMDINMPKKDGITATKEIRQWEKDHHIEPPVKIFALTGLGEGDSHNWVSEAGFDRLLSKPIKFSDLTSFLE
jgi:CheY-like chemotaxis protein